MIEPSPETKRTQFLLTNLVVLTIVILVLILVIAGYPLLQKPVAPLPTANPSTLPHTVTPPTETTDFVNTISPSPAASRTPRATYTSTPTPTRTQTGTPIATLTPTGAPPLPAARPIIGVVYRLVDWSPAQAERLVEYMNAYPNTLLNQTPKPDRSVYYHAFIYAILAQQEALSRYPKDAQANHWRWGLAYNLAQTGNPQAGQAYADLIIQALNQGEINIAELSAWFQTQEPRLSLGMIDLEPTTGYLSSRLLQIQGAGSSFIWLLESTSAYQGQVLLSQFDFLKPLQMNALIADLTGDGSPEAAIFAYNPPSNTFEASPPRVFDLHQLPAQELFFRQSQTALVVGVDFLNYWGINPVSAAGNELVFNTTVFPNCPVTIHIKYTWNGSTLARELATYSIQPPKTDLSTCDLVVKHAAQNWGADATIQILEQLIPILTSAKEDKDPHLLLQVRDEWRYRLGISISLTGNLEKARNLLNDLIATPAIPDSSWAIAASQFLQTYQKPEHLYLACVQSPDCNPAEALKYLIDVYLRSEKQDALTLLGQVGAQIRAAGYFDFDRDGQKERWFTIRYHPFEKLVLWILAASAQGEKTFQLGTVESDKPTFTYLDEQSTSPVVLIDNQKPFRLLNESLVGITGSSQEPYLVWVELPRLYPDKFKLALEPLQEALLSGTDPTEIYKKLIDLEKYPGLLCRNNFSCDAYYYFLGLSSELAGDERGAVDAYVQLWGNYSKSPYTIMARMKLSGISAGIASTPSATLSTYTPTPSSISTTPTHTATPTPENYPYPMETATEYNPYP
jgi:hypothetical protein